MGLCWCGEVPGGRASPCPVPALLHLLQPRAEAARDPRDPRGGGRAGRGVKAERKGGKCEALPSASPLTNFLPRH